MKNRRGKETHQKMINETEFKECEGCPGCCPEDYTTEVDIGFLRQCKNTFETLLRIAPDHTAPGWIKDIEEKIELALKSNPPLHK